MAQVVQKQPKSCTFAPIFCNKFASSSSLISVKIYFSLFVILSWNDQWALKTLDTLRRNFWQTAVLFLLLGPEKGHWKYFLSLKICLTKGWVCVRSYWKTEKFVSFSFSYLVGGSDEGPTPISEVHTTTWIASTFTFTSIFTFTFDFILTFTPRYTLRLQLG